MNGSPVSLPRRGGRESRESGPLSHRKNHAFSAVSSGSNSCTGWPGMIVEIACL